MHASNDQEKSLDLEKNSPPSWVEKMPLGFARMEMLFDGKGIPRDYRFLEVNSAFARLLDLEQEKILGATMGELFPDFSPLWLSRLAKVALTGESVAFESCSQRLGGCCLSVTAFQTEAPCFVCLLHDVSEQHQQEEGIRQRHRQENLDASLHNQSRVAGTMAYHFNNQLLSILGNLDMIREDVPDESLLREMLDDAYSSGKSAADLCDQLLLCAGQHQMHFTSARLQKMVEDRRALFQKALPRNIQLTLETDPSLPELMLDTRLASQAIEHVLRNAGEAHEGKAGTVTLRLGRTGKEPWGGEGQFFFPEYVEGREAVYCEVSDEGQGVDPQNLHHLCDPFYSTRYVGRGLGLALALGVMVGHKGTLWLANRETGGLTVRLLFPLEEEKETAPAITKALDDWRGSGVVLLVDDEEPIRRVCGRMLRRMGFEPLVARDGEEGVRLFEENQSRIRLVVLDLVMPKMNGEEALRAIRKLQPQVPVIVSSGFNQKEVKERFTKMDVQGILFKPYEYGELTGILRDALASCPPPNREGKQDGTF